MDITLAQAAEWLYDGGMGDHGTEESPRTFASQSTAERLLIIETYLRQVILGLSRQNYEEKAKLATGVTSAAYVAANMDL